MLFPHTDGIRFTGQRYNVLTRETIGRRVKKLKDRVVWSCIYHERVFLAILESK